MTTKRSRLFFIICCFCIIGCVSPQKRNEQISDQLSKKNFVDSFRMVVDSIDSTPDYPPFYSNLGLIFEKAFFDYDMAIKNRLLSWKKYNGWKVSKEKKFEISPDFEYAVINNLKESLKNKLSSIEGPNIDIEIEPEDKSACYQQPNKEKKVECKSGYYYAMKFENGAIAITYEPEKNIFSEEKKYSKDIWVYPSNIKKLTAHQRKRSLDETRYLYKEFLISHPESELVEEAKIKLEKTDYALSKAENTIQAYKNYYDKYNINGRFKSDADLNAFNLAQKANSVESYNEYKKAFPDGLYNNKADLAIEDLDFDFAKSAKTIEALRKYYDNYEDDGRYLEKADEEAFNLAKKLNKINSYEQYCELFYDGEFVDISKLRLEELYFDKALADDSQQGYEDFLSKYPSGKFERQIKEAQTEMNDFNLTTEMNTIPTYNIFLDKYPVSKYKERIYSKIEYLDFKNAQNENSKLSLRFYLSKYPNGKYKSEITNLLNEQIKTSVILEDTREDYDSNSDGVVIKGKVVNNYDQPLDIDLSISFSTKTEVKNTGSGFWTAANRDVFKGRSYVDRISLTVPAENSKTFSQYFDTLVNVKYEGFVIDIFNTQATYKRRLKLDGNATISLAIKGIQNVSFEKGESRQADEYLRRAAGVTESDGTPGNLGEFFVKLYAEHSEADSNSRKKYKLQTQIQLAENAVSVAPGYARARLALAEYNYDYALITLSPNNRHNYYKRAFEEASMAYVLDRNSSQAKALADNAASKARESAPVAEAWSQFMMKFQRKLLEASANQADISSLHKPDYGSTHSTNVGSQSVKANASTQSEGISEISGTALCNGYYFENQPIKAYVNILAGYDYDGDFSTDKNGHFTYYPKNPYKSSVSFKFIGSCGEGYIRTSKTLRNTKIHFK